MTEKERLLHISAKQIFETSGNTVKSDDINFMFRYIESLEYKIEKLEKKSKSDDEHIGKMAKRLKVFEDRFLIDTEQSVDLDILKLMIAYKQKGYSITSEQAENIWSDYSGEMFASWMMMGDDLTNLFEMTKKFATDLKII